jgi:hypothetical protein
VALVEEHLIQSEVGDLLIVQLTELLQVVVTGIEMLTIFLVEAGDLSLSFGDTTVIVGPMGVMMPMLHMGALAGTYVLNFFPYLCFVSCFDLLASYIMMTIAFRTSGLGRSRTSTDSFEFKFLFPSFFFTKKKSVYKFVKSDQVWSSSRKKDPNEQLIICDS